MLTAPHPFFGRRDLREAAAEVKTRGAAAERIGPGHRSVEGEIDLAGAGPVGETTQSACVRIRQPVARDAQDLGRREVENDGARRLQIVDSVLAAVGMEGGRIQ